MPTAHELLGTQSLSEKTIASEVHYDGAAQGDSEN